MRASFVGTVIFGNVSYGVKAFPVMKDDDPPLQRLHRPCRSPLGERLYCKACGQTPEPGSLVYGVSHDGRWFDIPPTALEQITPDAPEGRPLPILEVVPLRQINPLWFTSLHYLIPATPEAQRPYTAISRVLRVDRMGAITVYITRRKFHLGMMYTYPTPISKHTLMLRGMAFAQHLREPQEISEPLPPITLSRKEVIKTRQLLRVATKSFVHAAYRDRVADNVKELIAQVVRGHPATVQPVPVSPLPPRAQTYLDAVESSLKSFRARAS